MLAYVQVLLMFATGILPQFLLNACLAHVAQLSCGAGPAPFAALAIRAPT